MAFHHREAGGVAGGVPPAEGVAAYFSIAPDRTVRWKNSPRRGRLPPQRENETATTQSRCAAICVVHNAQQM